MSKYSLNISCPCQSGKKYKQCCLKFHKGAIAPNALILMKSRYSAYALNKSQYIMDTTHKDNCDYSLNKSIWNHSIKNFIQLTQFLNLEIMDYKQLSLVTATVSFKAHLSTGLLIEKSYFIKENNRWYYLNGEFSI